jgi:hypothetical protein
VGAGAKAAAAAATVAAAAVTADEGRSRCSRCRDCTPKTRLRVRHRRRIHLRHMRTSPCRPVRSAAHGGGWATTEISKTGLGMPPMRLLELAMAALRHEERVSVWGTARSCSGLRVWQAVTCVCVCVVRVVCEDEAEVLRTQSPNHDALAAVGYHARVSERAGNTLCVGEAQR